MQSITFIVLGAILVIQSTSAFPQLRARRDAQNVTHLSPEAEIRRAELLGFIVDEMLHVVENAVKSQKENFEKVVKAAEEADLKSDALKEHLKIFAFIVEQTNALFQTKDEETITNLFDLFSMSTELADRYEDIENPTEEEKLIKRLLDENGGPEVVLNFLVEFAKLRTVYENHIQEYVNSLSEEDKVKEAKFIEWFEKFKAVDGFENYVDVTMEIINFIGEDDSDEDSSEKISE